MALAQKKSHCTMVIWVTLLSVSCSVRITNLKVPATYTLDRIAEPEPLVLDCEFEMGPREKGFVLKWLFNNHSIYQWIPSVKGFPMGVMKSQIDTRLYTFNNSPGVISIFKPHWNMTGEYTCAVQTFESTDRRSARLQIIVPETDFILEAKLNREHNDNVDVMCAVQNVFPKPILSVILDSKIEDTGFSKLVQNSSGLFNVTVKTRISKNRLESPTPITCAFVLVGTNYTKRRETLFYDRATTIQYRWATIAAVVMSVVSLAVSS